MRQNRRKLKRIALVKPHRNRIGTVHKNALRLFPLASAVSSGLAASAHAGAGTSIIAHRAAHTPVNGISLKTVSFINPSINAYCINSVLLTISSTEFSLN